MRNRLMVGASIYAGLVTMATPAVFSQEFKYYQFQELDGEDASTTVADMNNRGQIPVGSGVPGSDIGDEYSSIWDNGAFINYFGYWDGYYCGGISLLDNDLTMFAILQNLSTYKFLWAKMQGLEVEQLFEPEECMNYFDSAAIDRLSPNGRWAVGSCSSYLESDGSYSVPTRFDLESHTSIALLFPEEVPIGSDGYALDVDNSGRVVGIISLPDYPYKQMGFIWSEGLWTIVEAAPGYEGLSFFDINESGLISGGGVKIADLIFRAAFYDLHTGVLTMNYIASMEVMNERGWWVGWEVDLPNPSKLTYYRNGQATELVQFFPEPTDPRVVEINDFGWIAGDWDRLCCTLCCDSDQFGFLLVPLYPKGDYDGDDDVDFQDFGKFQECFAAEPYQGPEGGLHVGCSVFDFDDDIDLDGQDFAAFQAAFTGPTAPDLNPTGPG